MSPVQFPTSEASIPDFESIAQSIKAIKRSVPAASGNSYTYFADRFKLAGTVADELDKQITSALTGLPGSLSQLKGVPTVLQQISKIDEAERAGEVPTDKAAIARAQLQAKLGTAVSATVTGFSEAATRLSEPASRLANYAREIGVRQTDAAATEASNQERAQSDVERESARLNILEDRYEKLRAAVDEARGEPTEDLVGLLPDSKELSSLVDIGAADAAAPEITAAKKAIEQAVEMVKKTMALIDKTIKFTQLTEIRDGIYKAVEAQRRVSEAAGERLRSGNALLNDLEIFRSTGTLMNSLAEEANKLVTTFSSFATALQDLDGKPVTADTLEQSVDKMESYLERSRSARNSVILA